MIDISTHSFCSDIFNGRLFPFEMILQKNEEYDKAWKKFDEEETLFLNSLSKEQVTHYEKVQNGYMECVNPQIEQAFKMGLKYAFEMLRDLKDIELKK